MLRFKLCVFFLMTAGCLVAQDHLYNKVWILGGRCGIDFGSGSPVAISASMEQLEGVASATGPNGKLLFYTDGSSVWNGNHALMPNGTDMAPYYNAQHPKTTESTTQAAVIVPMPDSSKYYIFSLTYAYTSHLFYSIVNMDLNGCSGDVEPTRKAILLDDIDLSEKMIAVRGNNCNIWLITHDIRKAIFKSYEITSAGLNRIPVISYSGTDPDLSIPNNSDFYYGGVMKASPDRTKLVIMNRGGLIPNLELHRFDPSTGKVYDGMEVYKETGGGYGACFSADNSKLYTTSSLSRELVQYDITSPDLVSIKNSRKVITIFSNRNDLGDISLGPDNKIYFSSYSIDRLPVINYPDLPGAACQFDNQRFAHSGSGPRFGLPNPLPVLQAMDTAYSSRVVKLNGCFQNSATLNIINGRDHLWDDGSVCKSRAVNKPGKYVVKYLGAACVYHIDTFIVPDIPRVVYPPKCSGPQSTAWFETLSGDTTTWNYRWNRTGEGLIRSYTGKGGDTLKNIQEGDYNVMLENGDGCSKSITFRIISSARISLLPEKDTICLGEPVILAPQYTKPVIAYHWNFGDGRTDESAAPSIVFTRPGLYKILHSVEDINGCTSGTVAKEVLVNNLPEVNAGKDISVLAGNTARLQGRFSGGVGSIEWSPAIFLSDKNVPDPIASPPATQLYSLKVLLENGCSAYDSMRVTVLAAFTVPNAFSPNGDGINDFWDIKGLNTYPNATVQIFNRWGQIVFQSYGYLTPWNGTKNGSPLPSGTYYYIIDPKNKLAKLQGAVTVIR